MNEIEDARCEGYTTGMLVVITLIREFERQGVQITAQGMLDYLNELNNTPADRAKNVIARAEAVIGVAEERMPIPDNVVEFKRK